MLLVVVAGLVVVNVLSASLATELLVMVELEVVFAFEVATVSALTFCPDSEVRITAENNVAPK